MIVSVYTMGWSYTEPLARHCWRFYLAHTDITIDSMSHPTYLAWVACNTIWNRLKPSEQDIVRAYHCSRDAPGSMPTYALANGLTLDYCWKIIKKAWKEWAIERGLADD